MNARRGRLMSWGLHREPGEPGGVVVTVCELIEWAFEPVAGVGKLSLKFCGYFGANFVAGLADAGAEGGDHVFWFGAELHLHAAESFCRDSADCAAPAGMNRGDCAALRVGEENGNAVSGLYDEQDASLAGGEG